MPAAIPRSTAKADPWGCLEAVGRACRRGSRVGSRRPRSLSCLSRCECKCKYKYKYSHQEGIRNNAVINVRADNV